MLYQTTDFQLDSEFHPADKIKEIDRAAKGIEEASSKTAAALWFGEVDLAIEKYNPTLPAEAGFTRDRHAMMAGLVGVYVNEAQAKGIPTRILITFGGGHVRGLVRKFEGEFGDMSPKPEILSSHASGSFHSHRYDFLYELEANPDLVPTRRTSLNMALENVFLDSPMCGNHPLRQDVHRTELAAMIYPRLKDYSDDQINEVLKAVEDGGFEQGLTKLTGVGEIVASPRGLSRVMNWPQRRISKFFALGR